MRSRRSVLAWSLPAGLLLSWGAPLAAVAQEGDAAPVDAVDDEDPGRPPPKGKGVVHGVVTDAATNDTLLDAQVSVVGGTQKALADVDGRYRLVLPPGTYELRVFYGGYRANRVQNVTITAGGVQKLDSALAPDKPVEEVTEITVKPDRATSEGLLVARKKSAKMSDSIGAAEMTKSPDRSAADAARRVVGATILGGRYVYVRGLGDRYTNSLLNGSPLPSPEPDRQAVPLDLFPALVLRDLSIAKTFTPDMPADFAGGSVGIALRELPEKLTFQVSLGVGANTATTFREGLSYAGGGLDGLGIDDGSRALPAGLPPYRLVRLSPKPDGSLVQASELDEWGRKVMLPMGLSRSLVPLNGQGSVVLGNTFDFGRGVRLGLLGAAMYRRSFQVFADERIATFDGPNRQDVARAEAAGVTDPRGLSRIANSYVQERMVDSVSWGGLVGAGLELGPHHKLTLTALHSQGAELEARRFSGFNEERAASVTSQRLRFHTRALSFAQLGGEHRAPGAGGTFTWTTSVGLARSGDPAMREAVYFGSGEQLGWDEGTLSGSYLHFGLEERSFTASAKYQQALGSASQVKLEAGALVSAREREFRVRRMRFLKVPGVNEEVYRQPPEDLFTVDQVGSALRLAEGTFDDDNYDASLLVVAGYAMTTAELGRGVRLLAGARAEGATQAIRVFDPLAMASGRDDARDERFARTDVDVLPALGLTWATSATSNLRAHVARTLARPQLRELAPFRFTDYFGARDLQGNPSLSRTQVTHADLRFELFPGAGEVLAVTAFFKHFDAPIEPVAVGGSSAGTVTFQNAQAAFAAGVEVEARKSLGFAHAALRDLSVLGNVTAVSSKVSLDPVAAAFQTNASRPLAGQAPYAVNLGLDYANDRIGTRARVLYNVVGPRIVQVGSNGLADAYEQPRHLLDVAVLQSIGEHVELRLTGSNLLDWPQDTTQGPTLRQQVIDPSSGEVRPGTNLVSSARVGATFTLSAAYSY